MLTRLRKLFSHSLFSGSIIVSIGMGLGNVFSYLFHLLMGRALVPEDYGLLTTLIAFGMFVGVIALTIQTVVAKFISVLVAREKKESSINSFLRGLLRQLLVLSFVVYLIAQFIIPKIQTFLHINDQMLLQITLLGLLLMILGGAGFGVLQGLMRFTSLAILLGSTGVFRVILGMFLVYLGWGVKGAVSGFFLSFIIPQGLAFFLIRKYLRFAAGEKAVSLRKILGFSLPSLFALSGLSLLISQDIVWVRSFFAPTNVGIYSGLSVVGRVIYFATFPVGVVMFPIISARYEKKTNFLSVFYFSLLIVLMIVVSLSGFYLSQSRFLIRLFYSNPVYLQGASKLGLMGLFFALFSIVSLFVNFFLSINKTKVAMLTLLAVLLQGLLIANFHESISQIIYSSVVAVSLVLVLFVGYFVYYFNRIISPKDTR